MATFQHLTRRFLGSDNILKSCCKYFIRKLCRLELDFSHVYKRQKCPVMQMVPQISLFHTSACDLSSLSSKDLNLQSDIMQKYLTYIVEQYTTAISGEQSLTTVHHLGPAVERIKMYKQMQKEYEELSALIKENKEGDEMLSLIKDEVLECRARMDTLEHEILELLIPLEKADNFDIILELSTGVGGQEAMLFNGEVFNMYASYAAYKGWQFEPIEYSKAEAGGVRKASASVTGKDVYKSFKYEGGVHRVQRVPKTEKSGRIHTSTMTVAVLPQPSEIEVNINAKDLKIETFRASGAGGQHVNTTDSAVRITHLPTGTISECQSGRSQIKNKETALKLLRSKIYEKEVEAQTKSIRQQRKIQVGTKGRSEKIRTYNYNQDRITDHRIPHTIYGIEDFMGGGESLEEMIELLQKEADMERLLEAVIDFQQNISGKSS